MDIHNFSQKMEEKQLGGEKLPENKNRRYYIAAFLVIGFLIIGGVLFGLYLYPQVAASYEKIKNELPDIAEKWVKEQLNLNLPDISEKENGKYIAQNNQEQAVIDTVEKTSPAVVSIIISKNVPIFEEYYIDPFEGMSDFGFPSFNFQIPQYRQKGTEKKEVGGGTGFIISSDGMLITNKHVVTDSSAEYTVYTNDGKKYPAKLLAKDAFQDLAILKIQDAGETIFSVARLGDSDGIRIGQTAIAIGNALGEFRNTVSVGVISGLGRTVTATGAGLSETIQDVIQTDAAINPGNSGGPLLNLRGEVIGINTAMASGAESIGFAIPINRAKRAIISVKETGKIVYPLLGVRYATITDKVKEEYKLPIDSGALVKRGDKGEAAVTANSAADKAGIKEGDVILEIDGKKVTTENSLSKILLDYKPGDTIQVTVLRGGKNIVLSAVLDERTE
jgi:serine protease Do